MLAFVVRRYRWVALMWLVRSLGRRASVDRTRADLERRLPESVVRAADRMPGDVVTTASVALVAGRQARAVGGVARTTARSTRRVAASTRHVAGAGRRLRTSLGRLGRDLAHETAAAERELTSELVRTTRGSTAATEAMLDLRRPGRSGPLPAVPPEIARGRRRASPARESASVARVQRTYRRARKPWEGSSTNR